MMTLLLTAFPLQVESLQKQVRVLFRMDYKHLQTRCAVINLQCHIMTFLHYFCLWRGLRQSWGSVRRLWYRTGGCWRRNWTRWFWIRWCWKLWNWARRCWYRWPRHRYGAQTPSVSLTLNKQAQPNNYTLTYSQNRNHQLSLPLCELYNKWKFVLLPHKYCSRIQLKAAGYGLHTCTIISHPDCLEHRTYLEATFPYEHTYSDKG